MGAQRGSSCLYPFKKLRAKDGDILEYVIQNYLGTHNTVITTKTWFGSIDVYSIYTM